MIVKRLPMTQTRIVSCYSSTTSEVTLRKPFQDHRYLTQQPELPHKANLPATIWVHPHRCLMIVLHRDLAGIPKTLTGPANSDRKEISTISAQLEIQSLYQFLLNKFIQTSFPSN